MDLRVQGHRREGRLSCARSGAPIPRFLVTVHDRENKDAIWLDRIEDGVRKYPCELAANILLKYGPSQRRVDDATKSRLDRRDKPFAQARLLLFVTKGAGLEFG